MQPLRLKDLNDQSGLESLTHYIIRAPISQERMRYVPASAAAGGLALAVIIVITFHYIEQVVTAIPPDLMELLVQHEVTRELLFIFGNYTDYVWSQWNAKNLYQAGAFYGLLLCLVLFGIGNKVFAEKDF